MKHIIFAIVALATIFATYGENLNRTYWGCEMGKTEQSACADSIKSLFKKEQIEPRTEGNFVIAEKVWLYGYEFDAAKLEFENSKINSSHQKLLRIGRSRQIFERNCPKVYRIRSATKQCRTAHPSRRQHAHQNGTKRRRNR